MGLFLYRIMNTLARTQVLERYLQSHRIQRWTPVCNHRVPCTRSRKQEAAIIYSSRGKKRSADEKYFDKLWTPQREKNELKNPRLCFVGTFNHLWLYCIYVQLGFGLLLFFFSLSCSTFLPQTSVNSEVLQSLQMFISHSASPLGNKQMLPLKLQCERKRN